MSAVSPPPAERGQTNQHYDQDPRLFALFLDSRMKYSPGIFESPEDSLETAQLRKLELIARSLGVRGGERVLDVGCGWGSLSLYLAERHRCHVTSLTPAPKQAEYVRRKAAELGLGDRVDVRVTPFEDAALPERAYDGVAFVGSITHMRDKGSVLAAAYARLRQGGRLYLSETMFRNRARRREFTERPGTTFVRDDVFGWADLPPLSEYVEQCEDAGFSLQELIDLTGHFRATIDVWLANIERNRAAIETLAPGAAAALSRYLEISNAGWGFTTKQYALVGARRR